MLSLEEGDEAELKCVDRVLDQEPVLDDAMLRLAAFVRERYFCTFYQAVRAILPVGLWFQIQDTFTLLPVGPGRSKASGSRKPPPFCVFWRTWAARELQRLEKGLPG